MLITLENTRIPWVTQVSPNEPIITLPPPPPFTEDAFQQTFSPLLNRFYTLFSSIVTYHNDLSSFLSDLSSGYYIQYTLDNLLQDVEGRQLLIETGEI